MMATTRRHLFGLGGFGVLAAGTSFVAATPALHPDAHLLDLVAQYVETGRRVDAINEPFYAVSMDEIPQWVDEQSARLVDECHRLCCEIGDTAATTIKGMAAKAQAALAQAGITDEGLDESGDAFLALNLCRDLIRRMT